MRIQDDTLTKLLIDNQVANEQQLAPLKEEAKRFSHSLQEVVLEAKIISEPDLTKLFARYADIPYIELNPKDITPEVLNHIPERIAQQYKAVIFQIDPGWFLS